MRLYNGCPDDELAALWEADADARDALSAEVKRLFGEGARARVTYFPLEGAYMAFSCVDGKYRELSNFSSTIPICAERAIKQLRALKEELTNEKES